MLTRMAMNDDVRAPWIARAAASTRRDQSMPSSATVDDLSDLCGSTTVTPRPATTSSSGVMSLSSSSCRLLLHRWLLLLLLLLLLLHTLPFDLSLASTSSRGLWLRLLPDVGVAVGVSASVVDVFLLQWRRRLCGDRLLVLPVITERTNQFDQ